MSSLGRWRIIMRSYPCETCLAAPGEPCTTSSGQVCQLEHVARQNATARCAKCHTMLDADHPGLLCDHCQLVRDLITEAHTTHQRET